MKMTRVSIGREGNWVNTTRCAGSSWSETNNAEVETKRRQVVCGKLLRTARKTLCGWVKSAPFPPKYL